jgi:sugar phosphate isomerase/epimerase
MYNDRNRYYELARENDFGIETVTFAASFILNDERLYQEELAKHISELSHDYPVKSMHGPFKDISIHSPDRLIAEVSKARIEQAVKTAIQLDSEIIILHTGINTLIRNTNYLAHSIYVQSEIYRELLDRNPSLRIYIENMWEADPGPFIEMYDRVASDRFGICLDTGHANIFSEIPVHEWIAELGERIRYFHLNDNHGEYDSESALGDGTIDWHRVFRAINTRSLQDRIAVLEVGSIENIINKHKRYGAYARRSIAVEGCLLSGSIARGDFWPGKFGGAVDLTIFVDDADRFDAALGHIHYLLSEYKTDRWSRRNAVAQLNQNLNKSIELLIKG